jgi:hypothetical protein
MKPYYEDEAVTIYHADCAEVLPSLDSVDLIVTSPPYNMGLVPGGNGRGMYRPGRRRNEAHRTRGPGRVHRNRLGRQLARLALRDRGRGLRPQGSCGCLLGRGGLHPARLRHRSLGRWYVVAGIVIGAGLSFLIAPTFALASGVAFLVSETADLTVYTPLERKSWLGAVVLSNTVGLFVDSWLFLTIAFGSLTFFWGQVVGKAWMTVLTIAVIAAVRGARALLPRYAQA